MRWEFPIYQTGIDKKIAIADIKCMTSNQALPLPVTHTLRKLGRDLAVARRKRGLSTMDMASRLFVSRDTLWRLERGDPTVAMGTLAAAAFVLQLQDGLADLAAPEKDALGLSLDEQRLPKRIRRHRA
jgi:DNA-binding XRE family transcriptional regulator